VAAWLAVAYPALIHATMSSAAWSKRVKMSRFHRKAAALIVVPLAAFGWACTAAKSTQTLEVSLQRGEIYQYPTVGGDEEGARIALQPNHSAISEIRRGPATNWVAVYVYQPAPGFVGSDYAELEILTGSDGASPPIARKVAIHFRIGD
jgi:hypothetical protein